MGRRVVVRASKGALCCSEGPQWGVECSEGLQWGVVL